MAVPGTPVDDLEDCSDIEQSLDKTLASVLLIAKAKVKPTKKIVLEDKDRQRQLALNEKCWRWRMATVEAKVFCSDEARLKKLLKDAANLQPNRNALAATWIGVLMSDQSLWPDDQWPKAKSIVEGWKQLKGLLTKEDVLRACDKPFRGMKSKQYLQIVPKECG